MVMADAAVDEVDQAQRSLLASIDATGSVDTEAWAEAMGWEHGRAVGLVKSLESFGLVIAEVRLFLILFSCIINKKLNSN